MVSGEPAGSNVTYNPSLGRPWWGEGADKTQMFMPSDGTSVQAHEIVHDWQHIFKPNMSGPEVESEAVRVENQIRALQGYSILKTYSWPSLTLEVPDPAKYVPKKY